MHSILSEHKDVLSCGRLKDCARISSCPFDDNVPLPLWETIKKRPCPKGARTPLSVLTWRETPLALTRS